MMLRRLFALPAAMALLLSPALARAQSCYELRREDTQVSVAINDLASKNPGYATAFVACAATAVQKYKETEDNGEATAAGGVCASALCIFGDSWSDCMAVNGKLFGLAIISYVISSRADEIGCGL